MDLLTTRTIEVTKLAMDGLLTRNDAISSNIANVNSPNYKRQEVSFEGQLQEILEKDDLRTHLKTQNSIKYNPTSIEQLTGIYEQKPRPLTIHEKNFLKTDNYGDFGAQVMTDIYSGADSNGNNVELEKEVMDMTKTGTKYTTLANLEQRSFKSIQDVIKGQPS